MNSEDRATQLEAFYKSEEVKALKESYAPYLNTVAKNKTDFTDDQASRLAIVLNNVERQLARDSRIYESTQPADIGVFKKHAMALIAATMPNLIAEDIVSIQPLMQKVN